MLFWDRGGFVVYYKRLAKGRFRALSMATDATHVELDGAELAMLLGGFDVRSARRTFNVVGLASARYRGESCDRPGVAHVVTFERLEGIVVLEREAAHSSHIPSLVSRSASSSE